MPFEEVEEGERHFQVINAPELSHGLTPEMLAKVDPVTAERWKLEALIGKHVEWLVSKHVEDHNKLFHIETEVIRSKKFRNWLWTRITLAVTAMTVVGQIFVPMLKAWLTK